jgi:hypothetical protein
MVGALGERPGGRQARDGGAPQPEGGAAGRGRDAGADAARMVPPAGAMSRGLFRTGVELVLPTLAAAAAPAPPMGSRVSDCE